MNNLRTVSDTKRAFYGTHTRPVNSIYRRVVEELMVEIHLLRVNEDFRYDPVFALGMVTAFDRFMVGYQPEADISSIFNALCIAEEIDPKQLRRDSEQLRGVADSKTPQELLDWLTEATHSGGDEMQWQFRTVSQNPKFKYSRLFAIGLFTLWEVAEGQNTSTSPTLEDFLVAAGAALNLVDNKLQKDWEIYRANLDKVAQARQTMDDILGAQRKRRQTTTVDGTDSDPKADLDPVEAIPDLDKAESKPELSNPG
ncbi:MAG: photosystem II biogenesis protein Psp29 [Acaryochloridaceae cyanobacterium SU_2_1]|nr:photosystem II biogenesis protein Psp29 [Acaryochloridaceae cyanobacterium SU_2_1]